MMEFDVVEAGGTRHENVIATPLLIEQGTKPNYLGVVTPVEAYCESTYHDREVWRMRDDSYDQPGTTYSRVRIEVMER